MSEYLKIGLATLVPNAIGFSGSFVTRKNIPDWYKHLVKPSWTPPNWVFGPVWTALYTGMGYASYLVYRDGGGFCNENALPLALYGTQLALNGIWTPLFFGYHKLGLATIEIGVLVGAVIATTISFYHVNPIAAYLMIPYIGWGCYASTISFSIWKNNKDRTD